MLFVRKVRGAFGQIETRDWALLAIETVSVVLGILIAFELNEWSIRRSEDKRAKLLVTRLFEESEDAVASLTEWRDRMRDITAAERRFVVQLSRGQCPAEADWAAVRTIGFYPSLIVPSSVYQEMMGSGGLAALRNPEARDSVQAFRAQLAFASGQIDYFRTTVVDPLPLGDTRQSLSYVDRADEAIEVKFERAALCGDNEFRNKMIMGVRNHTAIDNTRSHLTDEAISMCARLGKVVGRPCEPDGKPLAGPDATTARTALSAQS